MHTTFQGKHSESVNRESSKGTKGWIVTVAEQTKIYMRVPSHKGLEGAYDVLSALV